MYSFPESKILLVEFYQIVWAVETLQLAVTDFTLSKAILLQALANM